METGQYMLNSNLVWYSRSLHTLQRHSLMVQDVGGLFDRELSAVHNSVEVVNPLLVAGIVWGQVAVNHTQ